MLFLPIRSTSAQAAPDSIRSRLLHRYADNDDWTRLLAEPAVAPELKHVLGPDFAHLQRNLDVAGPVDVVGGALSVSGNAAHQGGEEEAVVCVSLYDLSVHAAILSDSSIRVYSRASTYEYLPRCITDWITLANSGHVDRLQKPRNVVLIVPHQ